MLEKNYRREIVLEDFNFGLSKKFNISIPSVLNYPKFEREVVSLDKIDSYLEGVIKCYESR